MGVRWSVSIDWVVQMRKIPENMTRTFVSILMAGLVLVMTGCASSLTLETRLDVPVPLTTQMPLTVAVYYPDEFSNYAYTEDTEDRPSWSIQCGTSQVDLFDRVLSSMFANVVQVDGVSYQGSQPPDIILVPEVEDMQFALPQETRTDLYEAWIKYRILLYYPDGRRVGEWPIHGYGKTTTELMKGRDEGLNMAINSAFRDIGAKFTIGFGRSDPFRQWQADKQAGVVEP